LSFASHSLTALWQLGDLWDDSNWAGISGMTED
jgi:hypothetical protein